VWSSIQQLVVKSLLPAQPLLAHHCKVLLGGAASGGKGAPRSASAPDLNGTTPWQRSRRCRQRHGLHWQGCAPLVLL
jgi:hypothetical protein